MGDWETILFERRVLWWSTVLVLLGTGLWLVALITPYWIIHIAGAGHEMGLVWGHSGVWRKCDLLDTQDLGLRYTHELGTLQAKLVMIHLPAKCLLTCQIFF